MRRISSQFRHFIAVRSEEIHPICRQDALTRDSLIYPYYLFHLQLRSRRRHSSRSICNFDTDQPRLPRRLPCLLAQFRLAMKYEYSASQSAPCARSANEAESDEFICTVVSDIQFRFLLRRFLPASTSFLVPPFANIILIFPIRVFSSSAANDARQ